MSRNWQMAGFAGAGGIMLVLVLLIMTGSGAIVSRLAAIDAERQARSLLISLEDQFDLPGAPAAEQHNKLDWLIGALLSDREQGKSESDVLDPARFEPRDQFGSIGGYAVFNKSGQLLISGGEPHVPSLKGETLSTSAREVIVTGRARVVSLAVEETGGREVLAVVIPLMRGTATRGVASIEIERYQVESLTKNGVQLVATASAIATGLAGLLGLFFFYRMARSALGAESRALFLANTDPATRLPNRHRFNAELLRRVEGALHDENGLALILLDIDNFKGVNDTFGHSAGDAFLSAIGEQLANFAGENELFRISGDQFAILRGVEGGRIELERVLARIQAQMSNQFSIGSVVTHITLSIGVAFVPADADTADELMRAADLALARAKADGRNTFRFHDADMSQDAADLVRFQTALAQSITRGEGLQLAYQPQVEVTTGRLIGFEALLRWTHPEYGDVSPVRFIPVAERSGLIHDLGAWALRRACNEARDWPEHMTIAVNLSALQIRDSRLPRLIESVLGETGLSPKRLELEVTESVMMEDTGLAQAAFDHIRALGVGFAMDDFGTGFSSLSYLTRLPLTKIKIDKVFVDGYGPSQRDKAVIDAVIAMARDLDMTVLAEGIETEEQAAMLCKAGCTLMQGYLFGRPTFAPRALIENELLGVGKDLRAAG